MKKIFIQGNNVVITENDTVVFASPKEQTKFIDSGESIKVYHDTKVDNYKYAIIDSENVKDNSGTDISGGVISWLEENTGHNSKNSLEPEGSVSVLNMVSLTQAQFDGATPIDTTFYITTDTKKGYLGDVLMFDLSPEHAYFITTWKTDNLSSGSSNDTSITIPIFIDEGSFLFDYQVSWKNDGVWESFNTDVSPTHDYGVAGTYTVAIRGAFPLINFGEATDAEKILSIEQWGAIKWESLSGGFKGCSALVVNAVDSPNLENCTSLSGMFSGAKAFNQYIGHWDLSNVTDISYMFFGASAFNKDIGSWNVGNVTRMDYVFSGATSFNQYIGDWNVSNVTSANYMFFDAITFNKDIGNWDVSKITDMQNMFRDASSFNQDIGNWDVGKVTNMNNMFYGVTLSTSNYDAILNGWAALAPNIQSGVPFNAGNSERSSASLAAYNTLAVTYGWIIADGGLIP